MEPRRWIDLNADLGESYGRWGLGDDAGLVRLVSSANVACGFHAGDPTTLRRAVAAAHDAGATVGAQVSYPDLMGFGRRAMDVAAEDLEADVLYQIGALDGLARSAGGRVRYVKPHGALYHRVLADAAQADALVAAVRAWDEPLAVVTMTGEFARRAAAAGLRVVNEAYADRATRPDGTLVPRSEPGAVLHAASDVVARVLELTADPTVETVCLHGDTPGAVDLAASVRAALADAGVGVRAFVPS